MTPFFKPSLNTQPATSVKNDMIVSKTTPPLDKSLLCPWLGVETGEEAEKTVGATLESSVVSDHGGFPSKSSKRETSKAA